MNSIYSTDTQAIICWHICNILSGFDPHPLGLITSIFMQFSVQKWSHNGLASPPLELARPPIWEFLDPPLVRKYHSPESKQYSPLRLSDNNFRQKCEALR